MTNQEKLQKEKDRLLSVIRQEDPNGYCNATDGSLEDEFETLEEQIECLRDTIHFIHAMNR